MSSKANNRSSQDISFHASGRKEHKQEIQTFWNKFINKIWNRPGVPTSEKIDQLKEAKKLAKKEIKDTDYNMYGQRFSKS